MRDFVAIIRDLGSKQYDYDAAVAELPRCEQRCAHLRERVSALVAEIEQLYNEAADWYATHGSGAQS